MEDKYTELYEKLSSLQWLLRRHHMMGHAENGPFADTTRGQGRVLAMLKLQPEISTKDLSYLLGIRIPSLNELLSKLEKGGYILRKPSEADKRVMIIHLTEKGMDTQQDKTDYSSIFDCLSEAEQITFGEYLDRVIEALEAQVGDKQDEDKMESWMAAMRGHMGDEQFERLMAMRGGFGHRGHKSRGVGFFGNGSDRRGQIPDGMPGAEHFSPDYDGPGTEGRRGRRGFGHGRRNMPPSPPASKEPHDSKDK
ncbi:MAG: MarR family winged helix-turn-helix transcriptional regulator [Lachnospiraceae bacterium]